MGEMNTPEEWEQFIVRAVEQGASARLNQPMTVEARLERVERLLDEVLKEIRSVSRPPLGLHTAPGTLVRAVGFPFPQLAAHAAPEVPQPFPGTRCS